MENTKYGRRREGWWTPIRAKAQDTRANPNSWKTHLVRKRWDIGLLRALNPRIMMLMMKIDDTFLDYRLFCRWFRLNFVTFCLDFTIRSNSSKFTNFTKIQKFPGIPNANSGSLESREFPNGNSWWPWSKNIWRQIRYTYIVKWRHIC